ncbi:DNA-directed RNA polymerase sigma-70 factor [Prolixibacter bellariivorans]|uniref:DNA-directed RNA polymerase sigma-70 factor n=1 Tax=Prolixibacter bellariivorans TaxID=314319 RepID=A0A5M4B4T5_9BACT|nr:DNA-directed RNA polymerase sigma-70 factor [Prolixibacter bellariivorans]
MTSFAITILKSEILAEEVVLDVFLRLWEKRNSLEHINNIETYLYISVRNKSISILKSERGFSFNMLDDLSVQLMTYEPSAENELIESEMFARLNEAVNQLPSKCKMIFKLLREDGLNRNEAAHILNISVKTVDNQIAIAVQKIAQKLNIDLSNPKNSRGLTSFLFSL